MLIDPVACPDLSGLDPRWPTPRPCCTPPRRICPAWPSSASGRPSCSTPSWPGGCSATRGSAWPRWSRPCSGCPWRRATRRRTGRPGRCPRSGCGTPRSTSRCWSSCATRSARQLTEQGKLEWARQEFAAVLAAGPPPPRADPWRRTSGIHRVRNRRGLAVVRELWQERDRIARQRDLSPTRVLPDAAIIEAARTPPKDAAALTAISGFTGRGARRHTGEWLRGHRPGQGRGRPGAAGVVSPAGRRPAARAPLGRPRPGGRPAADRGPRRGRRAGREAQPAGREPAAARRRAPPVLAAARPACPPAPSAPRWPPTAPGPGRSA